METAEVWAKLWEAAITYSERNNSRAAVCSYHFQRGNNPAAALHKQKPGRLFSEPRADSWKKCPTALNVSGDQDT